MLESCGQARNQGDEDTSNFFAPLEKCVGHSLKNLGPTQKTLPPTWCPKLVVGRSEIEKVTLPTTVKRLLAREFSDTHATSKCSTEA